MAPAAVISLSAGRRAGVALRLLGDGHLTRLAKKGDARAFAAIYERHHQDLFRYCRSITGNAEDASDALQSTMAAALRSLPRERREINLRPWLFRIAHNESISLIRRRRAAAELTDERAPTSPGPHAIACIRERVSGLVANLRELPERQRGALVMRELSGLDYGEIGLALGVSGGAARQAVYEARLALTELEEGTGLDCDEVRRSISALDGRLLRGRRMRAHLRDCGACKDFSAQLELRRSALSTILPPLPAAAGAAILAALLGGGGGAGAGVSVGAAASAGSGGVMSLLAGGLSPAAGGSAVAKGAAAVAVAVAAGVGTVEVAREADGDRSPRSEAAVATPQERASVTPGQVRRGAHRRAASRRPANRGTLWLGELARPRSSPPRREGQAKRRTRAPRTLRLPEVDVPTPQNVRLPSAPQAPTAPIPAPPPTTQTASPTIQPWQQRYEEEMRSAQESMQLGMQVYQQSMQAVEQIMNGLFSQYPRR